MDSPIPRLRSKQDAGAGDICSLLRIIVEGISSQEKENSPYWKQFALERFDEEFRKGNRSSGDDVLFEISRLSGYVEDAWLVDLFN